MDLVLSGIAGGISGGMTAEPSIMFLSVKNDKFIWVFGRAAQEAGKLAGFSPAFASIQGAGVFLTYFFANEASNWSRATDWRVFSASVAVGAINAQAAIMAMGALAGNASSFTTHAFARSFFSGAINAVTSAWSYFLNGVS